MKNASFEAYLEQREEQPWPLCAAFAAVLWQTRLHAAASARQDSVPCTGQRLACSTSPPAPLQCAYAEDSIVLPFVVSLVPYSLRCGATCDSSDILACKHRCTWKRGDLCCEVESLHSLAQNAHLSQLMYNQIESDVQASETKPSVPALGLVSLPCCPLLTCRPHDSALQITVHTCF